MKPDIVVCWPTNCDYPLWRKFIRRSRSDFQDVIIVITKANQGFDYSDFVRHEMNKLGCLVLDSPVLKPGDDWRNIGVNFGLKYSRSSWVWFTEQDFYPKVAMWKEVVWAVNNGVGISAVFEGERMHPCCIFVLRAIVDATGRNFGIVEGQMDHFGMFREDVRKQQTCMIQKDLYEHLSGLSHNFRLMSDGQQPNYHPERFEHYIIDCLECGEVLHPEFIRVCKKYINTEKIR